MNQTEDGLVGLPFLSEVLDTTAFKRGQANIIVAPCHSGKTTAAAKIIEAHAKYPERVLYLIDTSAGKSALLQKPEAKRVTFEWLSRIDPRWWSGDPNGERFVVMTYHQFGYKLKEAPTFPLGLDLIICDEMHNLIKYFGIEKANNEKNRQGGRQEEQRCCCDALNMIAALAKGQRHVPLVVIMTATTNMVSERLVCMDVPIEHFDYTDQVHSDKTKEIVYYADLEAVIRQIKERAIIFISGIKTMMEYAKLAEDGKRKISCLWSIHSDEKMADEDMRVRESILKTKRIPEEIDLLFINAAYETSLNIENEDFLTMVVHNSNPDTQIQVRGRIRHDIDKLYIYDKHHEHIGSYFPEEYLERFLLPREAGDIAARMKLRNEKGEIMKWRAIWPLLEKDGLQVSKERVHGQRGWRVHRLVA